jgi:hypothetical protein
MKWFGDTRTGRSELASSASLKEKTLKRTRLVKKSKRKRKVGSREQESGGLKYLPMCMN